VKTSARIWLTTFFAFGTIIWYESINGGSWQVSMLVANLMTLLALNEVFGDARPFYVGLWAGLAALSRYDLCLTWPVYFLLLCHRRESLRWACETTHANPHDASDLRPLVTTERRQSLWRLWSNASPALIGFALTAIIYVCWNEARFGTVFDTALRFYNPTNADVAPAAQTWFSVKNIPTNFFTLFYMAPRVDGIFPYIHPQAGGQSILTTSPAFLLALRAPWRKVDSVLMGVAAPLAAIPVLLLAGNGFIQFGTRHFVHCFPFLVVLMAMGGELDQSAKILIVTSMVLIAVGIYSIRMYGL
jgi:hypothetical protein